MGADHSAPQQYRPPSQFSRAPPPVGTHQQPERELRPSSTSRFRSIADSFTSVEQVQAALQREGLESSNLVVAVDLTKSNEWTGKLSFNNRCLHSLTEGTRNPYENVLHSIGRTLEAFDADGLIPAYGFGDSTTQDNAVFSFMPRNQPCQGLEQMLSRYRELVPQVRLAGPTSFAPAIRQAMRIVAASGGQYHILLIVADGQVTRSSDLEPGQLSCQEQETVQAIVDASNYPMSIVMVGVGDGPWDVMKEFDDALPQRTFDNFQFVEFTSIARQYGADTQRMEALFALRTLMEVPEQYRIIQRLGLLGRRYDPMGVRTAPPLEPPGSYGPGHDASIVRRSFTATPPVQYTQAQSTAAYAQMLTQQQQRLSSFHITAQQQSPQPPQPEPPPHAQYPAWHSGGSMMGGAHAALPPHLRAPAGPAVVPNPFAGGHPSFSAAAPHSPGVPAQPPAHSPWTAPYSPTISPSSSFAQQQLVALAASQGGALFRGSSPGAHYPGGMSTSGPVPTTFTTPSTADPAVAPGPSYAPPSQLTPAQQAVLGPSYSSAHGRGGQGHQGHQGQGQQGQGQQGQGQHGPGPGPRLGSAASPNVDPLFVCPITQEVMRDPVMCTDGYTYEREAITQWLHQKNTSPMTNQRLETKDLIPNHALRSSIMELSQRRAQAPPPATDLLL